MLKVSKAAAQIKNSNNGDGNNNHKQATISLILPQSQRQFGLGSTHTHTHTHAQARTHARTSSLKPQKAETVGRCLDILMDTFGGLCWHVMAPTKNTDPQALTTLSIAVLPGVWHLKNITQVFMCLCACKRVALLLTLVIQCNYRPISTIHAYSFHWKDHSTHTQMQTQLPLFNRFSVSCTVARWLGGLTAQTSACVALSFTEPQNLYGASSFHPTTRL